MNSCVCVRATVHLSKDEDDFTRIQTVQAQIRYLKLRDQEVFGLHDKVDWTDGHWRKHSLLEKQIADQFNSNQKSMYSVIQFCVSVETVALIVQQHEL